MAALYPHKVQRLPDALVEGEVRIFTMEWGSKGTPSAVDVKAFIKGESTDLTATLLTGTSTVSGSVQTFSTLTVRAGDGTKTYRLVAQATIGSETVKAVVEAIVQKKEGD